MYELKKIGKVFASKFVGPRALVLLKKIYRSTVSQRLGNNGLEHYLLAVGIGSPPLYWRSEDSKGSFKCGVSCYQGQNSPEDVTVCDGNTRMSDGMSVFVGFVCLP
jgi:hypothetical protein